MERNARRSEHDVAKEKVLHSRCVELANVRKDICREGDEVLTQGFEFNRARAIKKSGR